MVEVVKIFKTYGGLGVVSVWLFLTNSRVDKLELQLAACNESKIDIYRELSKKTMKMKNVKDMDLLERLEAPTPKRNKRIGQIFTAIGVIAGTILTAGVVTAPLGITILTIVTAVSGGVAVFNGQKVEE
jgi:hypothetical protein